MTRGGGEAPDGHLLLLLAEERETELLGRLLGSVGWSVTVPVGAEELVVEAAGGGDAVVLGPSVGRTPLTPVIDRIRALPRSAGSLPVVVVGDEMAAVDRVRAHEAGADALVTKPFHVDELSRLLVELLARSPADRVAGRGRAMDDARRAVAAERRARS